MNLFWTVNDAGHYVLCVHPAAKVLTLKRDSNGRTWVADCLGLAKELRVESLDTAKKLAEMWLCDVSCDLIIELRKRNATSA